MRRRVKGILMSGKQFSLDSRIDLVSSAMQTTTTARPLSEHAQDDLDLMREESVDTVEEYGKIWGPAGSYQIIFFCFSFAI